MNYQVHHLRDENQGRELLTANDLWGTFTRQDLTSHIKSCFLHFQKIRYDCWFTLDVGGNYVGYVCTIEQEHRMVIHMICVDTTHRKRGVGRKLLNLVQECKKPVDLWADMSKIDLARFYLSMGFIPEGQHSLDIISDYERITRRVKNMTQTEWSKWQSIKTDRQFVNSLWKPYTP